MPLTPGQTLQNRYRIVALLGEGGMGAVYRAWHLSLEVPVAIKEMVPQPGLDAAALNQLREQFKREAAVLLRLKHDNLVSVYDYFVEGGNTYLVMEYVEGESLAARIERLGPLPEAEVVGYADNLLDALDYCHSRRVIHRDIKPQNVIIRPSGDAVLVDFGLVKLWDPADPRTKTAIRGSGTPEYAPLEQYGGHATHTGPHSDIYSLGATLYHALVGEAPPTVTARMLDPEALKRPATVRRGVSARTEAAVLTAMAVQPGERYQSATAMRQVLNEDARTASQAPEGAPAPSRTQRMPGTSDAAVVTTLQDLMHRVPAWGWVVGAVVALGVPALLAPPMGQLFNGGGARVIPGPTSALTRTSAPAETSAAIAPSTSTAMATSTATSTAQPTSTPTPTPTPEPALAAGATRTREADGMVQVWVPGGSFMMGSEDGSSDEKPVHQVTLDGFWIDRTEVTNAQYGACVTAGACEASRYADDSDFNGRVQPVVGVSWHDAVAYCEWVGGRLPTEAEWEYAARGPEGSFYPWGDVFDGSRLNYCDRNCTYDWADEEVDDGFVTTAPVGSFPEGASWIGALDMAGNVWEWCADWYGEYPSTVQTNPTGPETGEYRVLRGGSWFDLDRGGWSTRSAVRFRYGPAGSYGGSGFRCASPQSP